jgi:hypothetical protein
LKVSLKNMSRPLAIRADSGSGGMELHAASSDAAASRTPAGRRQANGRGFDARKRARISSSSVEAACPCRRAISVPAPAKGTKSSRLHYGVRARWRASVARVRHESAGKRHSADLGMFCHSPIGDALRPGGKRTANDSWVEQGVARGVCYRSRRNSLAFFKEFNGG